MFDALVKINPKELAKDIKEKIQFLVTVEIFFFAFIYGFFKATGVNETMSNSNASIWAIGIALSVASYLIISKVTTRRIFGLVQVSIDVNIVCLILVMIITALVQHKPLPGYYYWPYVISIWGSGLVPIITFSIVSIVVIFQACKKEFKK